jgi:endoglucanase
MRAVHVSAWLIALTALLAGPSPAPATSDQWIGVQGNRLVDARGAPIRLLGVNRSGAEYQCVEGESVFEGPTDWSSIEAMKRWKVNAVRLPLNETCWLGINGVPDALSGAPYRQAVHDYVQRLERAGFYVILDLHWAAPADHWGTGLIPMPDADHALDFWRSVAAEFRDDRSLIFDVFNEPHDVSWECWGGPCEVYDRWFGNYKAVGMAELVETIRATGAEQPIMLGGLDWARDASWWAAYRPQDPLDALVVSEHTYDFKPCFRRCRQVLAKLAQTHPVVTGELGQIDCRSHYVRPYMNWADRHGISYLGWTWNTEGRWTCKGGPSLIRDWAGHPTRFGKGLREHLRVLAKRG